VDSDGSGSGFGVRIRVNGVPQDVEVEFDYPEKKLSVNTEFRVGRRVGGPGIRDGAVARVQLYRRQLSASELTALAAGLPDAQSAEVRRMVLAPSFAHAWDALNSARKARFDYGKKVGIPVMIMADSTTPRVSYRLERGNYATPDKSEILRADVPASLGHMNPAWPRNRLGLANWLISRDNPLTARVMVNRIWQQHFGVGLVKTANDFGLQGEYPSHPKLLDWLAADFMENGWDLKRLHRLIIMSATYRQDSRSNPQLNAADPDNRLLARGARFRLDAHALRDQALAVSGLLVPTLGGPAVKPYQAPGAWTGVGKPAYHRDKGNKLYRRTLYTFWRRTVAPTRMATFDAPTRETCEVSQQATNTPLQALTLLNDPTYVEAARVLAAKMIRGAAVAERLQLAAKTVLGRRLSPVEFARLEAALQTHLASFGARPKDAIALLNVGDSPPHPSLDPVEHAAYTAVMMTVLNLDETITRQ
jgi:hypothetical protein